MLPVTPCPAILSIEILDEAVGLPVEPIGDTKSVFAGTHVRLRVSLSGGTDAPNNGAVVSIRATEGAEVTSIHLAPCDDGLAGEATLIAPLAPGRYFYRAAMMAAEGQRHDRLQAEVSFEVKEHLVLLSAWGAPAAMVAGESLDVTVGCKCACGCKLEGGVLRVLDEAGAVIATGSLGDRTWPGSEAIYFVEFRGLRAPTMVGTQAWTVDLLPSGMTTLPHKGKPLSLPLRVVGPAEHEVTVRVHDSATREPVQGLHVVLHPYVASTDETGIARLRVASGDYKFAVSGKKYTAHQDRLAVSASVTVQVQMSVPIEDDGYPMPPVKTGNSAPTSGVDN